MKMKRRIFSGATCDQVVYNVSDRVKDPKKAKPRVRFKNDEERAEHRRLIGRRHHARLVNANFGPTSFYSTHTFDDEHEVHDFRDARAIRDEYYRLLKKRYPDAKINLYMGRGKSTHRIHFHMLSDGIPEEAIKELWTWGGIKHCVHLRENTRYNGIDCGQDYTGLANYLYDHWTREQGGRVRYKYSRKTVKMPDEEKPTECKVNYSPERPPVAPKGYRFLYVDYNRYGYMCFHYVKEVHKARRNRRADE